MKLWHRHTSRRGTAGLASICVAAAIISWVGHRSMARLYDEHARNQIELMQLCQQVDAINASLIQQQTTTSRNVDLVTAVNRPPPSKLLAEVATLLPDDCCAEMITFDAHGSADRIAKMFTIVMRCADVTRFVAQNRDEHASTCTQLTSPSQLIRSARILFNTIGDPTGAGFGWSGDLSATVVLTIDSTSYGRSIAELATIQGAMR